MATQQSIPQLLNPPKCATVITIPKPITAQITQDDLEEYILLRNWGERLAEVEADLKNRLQAGATVEPGVHCAALALTLVVR